MHLVTARNAADLLGTLLAGTAHEAVAVAFLGEGQVVLGTVRHRGAADTADLPIREIILEAVSLGAAALVLAHNHPSGDAAPSEADILATRRLRDTAEAIGLRLDDHLIFAGEECRSLRALGLL